MFTDLIAIQKYKNMQAFVKIKACCMIQQPASQSKSCRIQLDSSYWKYLLLDARKLHKA